MNITNAVKNRHAVTLGRKGGKVTSNAKANAARENGKRGGRPRKTLTDAIAWAQTATAGQYLIRYADTGLSDADDTGSRCGFGDDELAAIEQALSRRDLRLEADDRGLIAAEAN